jgi:hypothetical protein
MDPSPVNHGRNLNRTIRRRSDDKAIRDYIILHEDSPTDLERSIMAKVGDGYVPQGGISYFVFGRGATFLQAMIKY